MALKDADAPVSHAQDHTGVLEGVCDQHVRHRTCVQTGRPHLPVDVRFDAHVASTERVTDTWTVANIVSAYL
jgi:hypothetical protein